MCRAVFCLTVLLVASSVVAQESSREDFEKFCADIEGRWVGNVTWITDWPGLGKKGDTITGYYEGRISADGNLMNGKFFGGDGAETSFAYYHPAAKGIRWTQVDTGGTVSEAHLYRQDGKWVMVNDITLADGTKGEIKGVGTITDGGKTWTWLANGKIGDDVVKDQKDIWRRVSK